jgi:3-oxoacid CoA-transferase
MIDKVVGSVEEAVSRIHDGASIAIGGFGQPGFPGDLVDALSKLDVTDLHIIANGIQGDGITKLASEHRVRKLSAGFPFGGAWNPEVFSGKIEVEVLPQGTLSERLRAGGAGIAGFYTPTSIGTAIADGTFPKRFDENGEPLEFVDAKEVREFNGRNYVLERGIRPDFGLIKATKADRLGNLYFRLTSRNFNPSIAMAAHFTIVQAHEIVEPGELDPNEVHVPGVFVDAIVHVSREDEIPPPVRIRSTRVPPPPGEEPVQIGWTREQIAENIGNDIGQGWYINLGVGMPILAAKYVDPGKDVIMHMENGILGAGGPPEVPDPDLVDAGAQPVTLRTGAAIFDSALSFSIVRGGYLDLTVLGGLQVSGTGDLANWYMPKGQTGVGGAMDLVQGAKRVWVAMEHVDRNGNPKILNECTFTLTGPGVVKRIYTDLAIFSLEGGSLELVGLAPDITVDYVRERTEPSFTVAAGIGE